MDYTPLVSVIIPVYNGGIYLHSAISCILDQDYQKLEVIIIDDGSSDDSEDTIRSFDDPRIRFFKQSNQGLASTLNRGISIASGKYIARQDQDDISNQNRLALQVAYLEDHPDCVLLGSWAQVMEKDRLVERFHRHPTEEDMLRYQLLFNNPFVHSSVLLRRSALLQVGGYTTDPERQPPEDYELWSRLSRIGSVANIGKVLLIYREIPGSMSRVGPSPFRRRLIKICAENIAAATGLPSDDSSILAIAAFTHGGASELQQRPDFDRMKHILLDAINGLGTGDALLSLRQDAIARVQAMQTAWMIRATPAYHLLNMVGPLRSMAKRIWRLTRSLRKQK